MMRDAKRWCRLEQWAAMAAGRRNLEHILLFTEDAKLVSVAAEAQRAEWIKKSL